uniref:Olfactomedin-like domain-containing protein n=1 Tax=Varanus komodoensis TaxID=61221 RepID=A0A8D2IS35_VARKO
MRKATWSCGAWAGWFLLKAHPFPRGAEPLVRPSRAQCKRRASKACLSWIALEGAATVLTCSTCSTCATMRRAELRSAAMRTCLLWGQHGRLPLSGFVEPCTALAQKAQERFKLPLQDESCNSSSSSPLSLWRSRKQFFRHSKTEKCSLYFPTGTCDRGMLIKVSAPVLVKLNWKGSEFKAGSWGKDFAMGTKFPDHYWVFPANKDERTLETYQYTLNINSKPTCENCGQGGGVIFFNGSFFYNCFDSRNLCKLNIATHELQRVTLEGAAFNNWFSYAGVNWQDFDFAGDEKGLWIIYSTESSKGKIIIGKLDPNTMNMIQKWQTSLFKPNATNTFMICGVLYALKRVSAHKEKIFYTYDTNTGMEGTTDIMIEKLAETFQSVSYNPNDHKLYMYNDGYLQNIARKWLPSPDFCQSLNGLEKVFECYKRGIKYLRV